MFPTFISILDIQSWWEVPSIAHFCSLFRTAFNLLDFDIEDLEEALLTDGTEETSWLQELIVRLLSGCLPNNEISTFNYQMFLRRLFRQKCQEHDRFNPFNTDCDFTLLPLRTKVDILHALCDFRLDAEDVLDQLKNLEADSLRVEPLGYDQNDSAYWYFYGTRLYREDFHKKNNKKKAVWQVICFTEEDWFQLTKKFKSSSVKNERALYHTLSKNFLPELPRLFKEKERQARRRLLENQPRRTSDRIRKLDSEIGEKEEQKRQKDESQRQQQPEPDPVKEEQQRKKEQDERRRESYEKRSKLKEAALSEEEGDKAEKGHEMVAKKRGGRSGRQRKQSTDSNDTSKEVTPPKRKKSKLSEKGSEQKRQQPVKLGRQTNNSLSALDGQILIQQGAPPAPSNKKKLKTSQVFQQTDEDLLIGMHKILDYVKDHEDAWPFLDPVEEEYAPNYYSIIRRPMDLTRMEDRLDQGYYKSFDKFKGDFQLIVNNCRLYNGAENEYTQMVDNLIKVFEKATERYLDQISSSDEEIAVENLNYDEAEKEAGTSTSSKKKKKEASPLRTSGRGRKSGAQKKRERSPSRESEAVIDEDVEEPKPKKSKKDEKQSSRKSMTDKEAKESKKKDVKREEKQPKKEARKVLEKSVKKQQEKEEEEYDLANKQLTTRSSKSSSSKKDNKSEEKKVKKPKKRGRKKKKSSSFTRDKRTPTKSLPSSPSPSPSPPRSMLSTPPPSSDEDKKPQKSKNKHKKSTPSSTTSYPWETSYFDEDPPPKSPTPLVAEGGRGRSDGHTSSQLSLFAFKKDKHNKLRETIEKLKAKSEISRLQTPVYDFEVDDHLKENKDKNKKTEEKQVKPQHRTAQNNKTKKNHHNQEDTSSNATSHHHHHHHSDFKKSSKKSKDHQSAMEIAPAIVASSPMPKPVKESNYEALSLATEQTLKDINKWLDDTPKSADFSSASNSPSYLALDEFDLLGTTRPFEQKKIVTAEKSVGSPMALAKKDGGMPSIGKETFVATIITSSTITTTTSTGNSKKKSFRDPSKFFNKRREVQRTIDRLQPGKGKGNLITNVQSTTKNEEMFPLGHLSKIKDMKNSLIVKTDTNAPKLSLGSVLDSFGKHKFAVDDQKKEEEVVEVEKKKESDTSQVVSTTTETENAPTEVNKQELKDEKPKIETSTVDKEEKDAKVAEDPNAGGPTPNLSAWFKAFGAPKPPPPLKKPDKQEKEEEAPQSGGVPPADPSPNLESPQPMTRQRRVSTGSSMSERSSFSQDLDSPRVGMEERGAYPAPYPSPLHRSPSNGASPIMASPRPDISPRSPYAFSGGQMRVGFYQDTVASSTKSSPDKSTSCSPHENAPTSPYPFQPVGGASEHVYAPNTTQGGYSGSYTASSPYYTHPPSYSSTNPTPPYNLDGSSNAYYDTTKIASDQYQAKSTNNYSANSPASSQASPASAPSSSHSPLVHNPQTSPSIHSPSVHSSQHSHSPQLPSPGMSIVSPQVNSPGVQNSPVGIQSPLNPASVEPFLPQHDETSSNSTSTATTTVLPASDVAKEQTISQQQQQQQQPSTSQQQPVFPVKKRAFLDSDLSSHFAALQEEMMSRGLHQDLLQKQHEQLLQQQYQKEQQEAQHFKEAQEQLQKHQQHLQQQQQQKNQLLQQQQQQQLLQEQQKKQQLLQHQKNMQMMQQQAMAAAEQSLRTPSPPSLLPQQQQRQQQPQSQQQQQAAAVHSESSSSSIRSLSAATSSYPATTVTPLVTSSAPSYFNTRDSYTSRDLNAGARTLQSTPKLDMSKFTNMGYTGAEVNFTRALQQQYARPELSSYSRATMQSAISQASQLLNSQTLSTSSQSASASSVTSLPGYQKTMATSVTNHQQAHSATYQSNRSVDSVAERLAAQAQQEVAAGYKQDGRSAYNSSALDLEQALGLSRNLVDRYSNEQRMMAAASNSYYSDKGGLGGPHVFNKQLFSQSNMAMGGYSQQQQQQQPGLQHQQPQPHLQQQQQQQQQQQSVQSLYGRQMTESLQQHTHDSLKSVSSSSSAPEKKQRKKKSTKASLDTSNAASSVQQQGAHPPSSNQQSVSSQPQHGFQSYAGLKSNPAAPSGSSSSSSTTGLDPAAIALKTSSVPGSAFNFGSGALGMGTGLPDSYPNLLDDFRGTSNYFMGGTAGNPKPGQAPAQGYPPFLTAAAAAAHQGRGAPYSLGGPFMDTSSPLYQHYLQAGVLNQGLLGAAAAASGYPTGYHAAALAMRQPYDSMTRPSWI